MCLSTGGCLLLGGEVCSQGGCLLLGGVCSGGGWYPSMHWGRPPRERQLLLRTVRILLECILVASNVWPMIPLFVVPEALVISIRIGIYYGSEMLTYIIERTRSKYSVVYPGFFWGGAPTPKVGVLTFFAENCMKMKEASVPGALPPWIRQWYWHFVLTVHLVVQINLSEP